MFSFLREADKPDGKPGHLGMETGLEWGGIHRIIKGKSCESNGAL